jgi:hypothetical protein
MGTVTQAAWRGPVLVYQMGKVGSVTVHQALERLGVFDSLWHVHVLSEVGLRRMATMRAAGLSASKLDARAAKARRIRAMLACAGAIPRPFKVVTLTREPVARSFSAYFHHLGLHQPGLDPHTEVDEAWVERTCAQIFSEPVPFFSGPEDWFQDELAEVFGLDVFEHPFPNHSGHGLYRAEGVEVLVLRLEDLHRGAAEALQAFLGVEVPGLPVDNRGLDRPWTSHYRRFLESVVVPREILDRVYGSRYARHFYSPQERAGFADRWSGVSP